MINKRIARSISMVLVCIAVLGVLAIPAIVSAAPSQVWVGPEYDEGTDGWGVTRFSMIQDAVDAVAKGGTVNVAAGTYFENVVIKKSLSLLGEGADTTTIEAQGSGSAIFVDAMDVILSGFTFIGSGEEYNPSLKLVGASNITIMSNRILERGILLGGSHNNSITNNYFDSRASIMLHASWGNRIVGNEIHAHYPQAIGLYGKSNNNVILNNTIIGVQGDAPCTGIRSIQSSNNLYENNTIRNFRVNVLLSYTNDSIVANNNISGSRGDPFEEGGSVVLYCASNNTIINNNISLVIDAGISLFGSSNNNVLQGNTITGAEQGIELHYSSDNNERQGYDDGGNFWDHNGKGNYWSDYEGVDENGDGIGDTPYTVPLGGTDHYPLIRSVEIESLEVPGLELAPFEEVRAGRISINDQRVWGNQTIELTSRVHIQDGGNLKLKNVTLLVKLDHEISFFEVHSGGTLQIYDSKIFARGGAIWINKGATFHIENSELYGLGTWDAGAIKISADGAVIKNNIIHDAYTGIGSHDDASRHSIIGNKISNVRKGISWGVSTGNIVENNEISNVIREAIDARGLIDSTIVGNTFQDVWGHAILLMPHGNVIYGNNFINVGSPAHDAHEGGNNQWYYEGRGNYWSDYQERYPDAWEHPEHKGIWDTPYAIPGGDSQDLYPLMPPTPMAKTKQATNVTLDSATLNSVQVYFEYRKTGETDWTSTTPATYNASGSHSNTRSGLEPDTDYEFRAQVKYNGATLIGEQHAFRTSKPEPAELAYSEIM